MIYISFNSDINGYLGLAPVHWSSNAKDEAKAEAAPTKKEKKAK